MALCRQYGIPYSQFRAGGDGRWTAGDQAKGLAYEEYLRGACPQCGTRESEWVDDNGDFVDAYIAVTHTCFGCDEISMKQKEIPEGQAGGGLKVLLLPAHIHAAQQLAAELGSQ